MPEIEILELIISASVPVLIALFGFIFSRHLKAIEHTQWQNRKIIEMRLELYKELAPNLTRCTAFAIGLEIGRKFPRKT